MTNAEKLMKAVDRNDLELLKDVLKEAPLCIDERSEDSYTALIIAAYEGKHAHVQALVSAGADLTLKDNDGTALENAMKESRESCVEILLKAGSPVEKLPDRYIKKYALLIEKHCPELWGKVEEKIKEAAKNAKIEESFQTYKMVNDFIVMKSEGKIDDLGEIRTMFNLRAQTVTEIVDKNPATARGFDQFTQDNSEEIVKAYEFSVWKGKENKQPFKKVDRVKI